MYSGSFISEYFTDCAVAVKKYQRENYAVKELDCCHNYDYYYNMIKIANPIYDVVFKYLLEDNESAVLLISSLIGEEIIELRLLPSEKTFKLTERNLTVLRLDFSAKIRTEKGYKQVIIEIQKAKLASDIMRFRRYLGKQYADDNNTYIEFIDDQEVKKPYPILNVYFLGHKLENTNAKVIKVNRKYTDATNGHEIKEKEEFIECLSHDSIIVQIAHIKEPYKSELEKLLSIFDQSKNMESKHLLLLNEKFYPQKYRRLLRRLQTAMSQEDMDEIMAAEDEILEDLQNLERQIYAKEKSIKEKEKTIKEKDKTIKDNKRTIEDNKRTIEEKDKMIQDLLDKLKNGRE